LTSAPCSNNNLTILIRPFLTAKWSAVWIIQIKCHFTNAKIIIWIVFDVTYSLYLSNQLKTNKLSSIWISIEFHKCLILHTSYIYQINQINQKQTNYHQFQYQSNFINIWCYILPTFIKSIKSIKSIPK
jgi:hypothetical protein